MTDMGTRTRPLADLGPMKVARNYLEGKVRAGGQNLLWTSHEDYLVWYGGERWERWKKEVVQADLAGWLEECWWQAEPEVIKAVRVKRGMVEEVEWFLRMLVALHSESFPLWLDPPPGWEGKDKGLIIAFQDVLVSVEGGKVETTPRGMGWVDLTLVRAPYDPKAECPVWMKCLEEWGGGDPKWGALLQRWMGYVLCAGREYERWMLFQGKIRGGKGTIDKVIRALLKRPAYFATSMELLGDTFGLSGAQYSRVISIPEVNEIQNAAGERLAAVMKQVVGRDEIRINEKHTKMVSMELSAAMMLGSNIIPMIPNHGMGLSGKMLVLPFHHSFVGREDFQLVRKLLRELQGIAVWAVEGARQLEEEQNPREKWPVPEGAREVEKKYRLENNPFDGFLEARFLPNKEGFTPSSFIWKEWMDYCEKNPEVRGVVVGPNSIKNRLLQKSTWSHLREGRMSVNGQRGLFGMSLKGMHAIDDEL